MERKRRCGALLLGLALALGCLPGARETVQVSAAQADTLQGRVLIPGGQAVGVAMKTQGVLVVSRGSAQQSRSPLRPGDIIVSVQGEPVSAAGELAEQIGSLKEDRATVSVLRGERLLELEVPVPVSSADGRRRLGVWVRDSTAGVGTLSYIDPVTQAYGALGHAIVDADTGDLLAVKEGAILQADVVGVVRGESGHAGELKGSFLKEDRQIGTLEINSTRGIYGTMSVMPQDLLYPQGLPAADRSQVHEGAAQIISTVDLSGPQAYDVEILHCFNQNKPSQKDMILRVTDERLIEKTGGIVQGMSGSPVIQNGRIVGAVTHVLVNDPTRGYGIFIENMLEAAK